MDICKFLKAYIGNIYAGLVSLCTILGFVALFIHDKTACIVAVSAFCIGLFILICGIFRAINKLVQDYSDREYRSISSFYNFQSNDGCKSTFEVYRLIQCKRLFLTGIPYNFKWTGTKVPILTSNAQTIENINHNKNKNAWDCAFIKFSHPLRYNECTVVNVKSDNDDYDGTAKPWLSCKLETPIEIMFFRVMLSYKPEGFKSPAVFERKQIGTEIDGTYEYMESVEFNAGNKQYSFCKVNPEPGYIYRLRWEK